MWTHLILKMHQQTSEGMKMPWESSATRPYLILRAKTLSVWCQQNQCLQTSQAALICFLLPLSWVEGFYYAFNDSGALVALIAKIDVCSRCHY